MRDQDQDQDGLGLTVVLRRQPVRIVAGRAEGGYTDAYELVCCECGDHPDLDYRAVSPELQQIRGPTRSQWASRRIRGTSRATTGGRRPPLRPRGATARPPRPG